MTLREVAEQIWDLSVDIKSHISREEYVCYLNKQRGMLPIIESVRLPDGNWKIAISKFEDEYDYAILEPDKQKMGDT